MFINKVTEPNPFLVTGGVGSVSDFQIMFLHLSKFFEGIISSNENWEILSKVSWTSQEQWNLAKTYFVYEQSHWNQPFVQYVLVKGLKGSISDF